MRSGSIPAVSTRTFRLSLSDAGELAYLPPICEALHRLAPRVKLRIEPTPVEEIEEALRVSRLDFAIGNLPELTARHAPSAVVRRDLCVHDAQAPRLAAGRADRPGRVSPRRRTCRSLSVEHSHHALEDAFRSQGVGRNTLLELPHFVALPSVLGVTDYYATLPRRLAQIFNRDGRFRIYELPVQLPVASVTMHWHEQLRQRRGQCVAARIDDRERADLRSVSAGARVGDGSAGT